MVKGTSYPKVFSFRLRMFLHFFSPNPTFPIAQKNWGAKNIRSFPPPKKKNLPPGFPDHIRVFGTNGSTVRYLLDQSADPRSGSTFGEAQGATALWQVRI